MGGLLDIEVYAVLFCIAFLASEDFCTLGVNGGSIAVGYLLYLLVAIMDELLIELIEMLTLLHGEEVLFVPCSFERLLYFLTACGTDEVVAMAYSSLVYSN